MISGTPGPERSGREIARKLARGLLPGIALPGIDLPAQPVMSDEDINVLVRKLGPAVTRALGGGEDGGGCGVRPRIT
jgi:hypothetical protein